MKDFPHVKNIFAKSDNVGCFAGYGYLEGEHHVIQPRSSKTRL